MNHRHFPRYNDDADFTTNAPSYYEDLARKEKLIRLLAERIWGYEKILDETLEQIQERFRAWDKNLEDFPEDVKTLLQQWLDDGTLDHIINDTIFNWKLDTSIFEQFRDTITAQLQQTATDLAGRSVNVNMLGAKNGENVANGEINSTIINNSLNQNEATYIPDGIWYISSPIIVPTGKTLELHEKAIIKPTGNIDIFILRSKCTFLGGQAIVSHITGYSKSIVSISNGALTSIKFSGLRAFNSYENPSGKALNLDCTFAGTKYLAFSYFNDFHFEGFQYGLYVNNTGEMNFANANNFTGIINSCTYAVYNNAEGNYINIVGEVGKAPNNEPAIYLNGGQNIVDAIIFDLGRGGGWNRIGLINDGVSNVVRSNFGQSRIIDNSGGRNNYPHSFLQLPNARSTAHYNERGTIYAGDQSNYLVAADKRFVVSESLTNVANWSSLAEAFKVNESTDLIYHFNNPSSLTDNAQVTIDFGTPIAITLVGVNLKLGKHCKRIVMEYYTVASGGQWVSKEIRPKDAGNYMWDIATEPNVFYNTYGSISKLRLTFYEPASTTINIHQIFAASDKGGYSFMPRHGGKFYGDVDLNKNKIKNMSLDYGTVRPSSPANGQIFRDDTIGKIITFYFSEGTWKDAMGNIV